jgi:hypothetical protein
MVPWWKRLVYSLVSVILTGSLCGAIVLLPHFLAKPTGHHSALAWFGIFFFFECLVLTLTLPCWLLATPLILTARNFRGWHFRMYWGLGSLIGPLYWAGRTFLGFDWNRKFYETPLAITGIVSVLASLAYLLATRREERLMASN